LSGAGCFALAGIFKCPASWCQIGTGA